jgi:hypothetical protein
MIDEIHTLMDEYSRWLRDKTALRDLKEWVEITTPHLDRHNDHLQMYVKKEGEGFLLSDDGYIINDLEMSGCDLRSPKRQEVLKVILNGHGVQLADDALQVRATRENFPLRKHSLTQAMLAVNDMFCLAQSTVASLFLQDVRTWLEENEVRFIPTVKLTGASGYDHVFDFAIPASKSHPERILKVLNRPNKESAQMTAFAWVDTQASREKGARIYAVLNDREGKVASPVIGALKSYSVMPLPWSDRSKTLAELAG